MASQYRKIDEFPGTYWENECPVTIEKMRLVKDTLRGVNALQIVFRNVSNANIYGMSISIVMKDFSGRRVLKKDIEYHYYGLEVPYNKTFGNDDYIIVEPEGKSFIVTVTRVEFSEGALFRGHIPLKLMPEPSPLESMGDLHEPFVERLCAAHPKINPAYAFEEKMNYWRCVCGRVYPNDVDKCTYCKTSKTEMKKIIKDIKTERKDAEKAALLALELEKQREEELRLQKEEEARLRLEQEEKERQEKKEKQKKITLAVLIVIALIALLLALKSCQTQEPVEPVPTIEPTVEPTVEPTIEPTVVPEILPPPVAVIADDLTDEELRIVLRLIGMDEAEWDEFEVIHITQDEVADYLEDLYAPSMYKGRSLSSLLITPTAPGSGLNVSTYNISYFTDEMLSEVLLECGITDADVVVAGPKKVVGTAAIAGIMKAGEYYQSLDE